MDKELSTNDFKNTCRVCKDCAFQNQSHWFKAKCKVFTFCKPDYVFNNEDCEFYTKNSFTDKK